jgi:Gpi18-like mannosyltransferase
MALTGLDFPVVGSTIALLCGFGAAALMGLLLRDRIGDRAALAVVVLWASFPASVALQLAYTESLAVLLLAGYLYALDRRRWLVATAVAVLVGLSRPIGIPLGLVTLVVVIVRWRRRSDEPIGAGEYAAMAASLAG